MKDYRLYLFFNYLQENDIKYATEKCKLKKNRKYKVEITKNLNGKQLILIKYNGKLKKKYRKYNKVEISKN